MAVQKGKAGRGRESRKGARTQFSMGRAMQGRLCSVQFNVGGCAVNWGTDLVEDRVWLGMTSQDDPPWNPDRPGIIPITENNCEDALERLLLPGAFQREEPDERDSQELHGVKSCHH